MGICSTFVLFAFAGSLFGTAGQVPEIRVPEGGKVVSPDGAFMSVNPTNLPD